MAKSIFDLLDTLETETSVPAITGKKGEIIRKNMGNVKHTLPRAKFPTGEQFEDEEKLLAWAKKAGVLHQCLQTGVQGRLIDYRAIFKSCKKDEVWTPETGQKKVNEAEWTVVKRPQAKRSKQDIAMDFLSNLSPEERKAFIAENFS